MTNQLLLAQVLAEGFTWDYLWHWTHDDGLVRTLITAVIAGFVSLCVAWWSGRKIDKQMELSKQANPPELTRYKTWLEVSETFKELEGVEDTRALADSEEYQEIEASRKVALERAVWERKVISECPNIQAQKLVMELPESKIYTIHNPDISRGIELSVDSYLKPKAFRGLWVIPFIMFFFFPTLMAIASGDSLKNRIFALTFSMIVTVIMFPALYYVAPNQHNGIFEANYFIRKKRVEILLKMRELEGGINYSNIFCKVDQYWEKWYRKEGLRYASIFDTWEEKINCPWVGKGWFKRKWHKVWCYFIPGFYVRSIFKPNIKYWGSYKEEILNVNLNQKDKGFSNENQGNNDYRSLNSDIQEESQPTPPQG